MSKTIGFKFVWGVTKSIGGTERRMIEACRHLVANGHSVTSIHNCAESNLFIESMERAGARVHYSTNPIKILYFITTIPGEINWHFGSRAGVPLRFIRMLGLVNKVWSAQNGLDRSGNYFEKLIDRKTGRWVDLVIANSNSAAIHAREKYKNRVEVVTAISALGDLWQNTQIPDRNHDHVLTVGIVGNNRPEKNHKFAIEVLSVLKEKIDFELRIFTNSGGEIQADLEKCDLTNQSEVIAGHVLTPEDYQSLDLLLHTSLSESLPMVLLEARSQGCFVLSSPVGDSAIYATHICDSPIANEWVRAIEAIERDRKRNILPDKVKYVSVNNYVDLLISLARK